MTARQIEAGGISWGLTDTGPADAPAIFLLHGNRDSKEMWQPLIDELPGFRLIAVDLPGHGSSSLPGGMSMTDHVAALGSLLGELDLTAPATVAGHSVGGQLAIGLAAARPGHTGRLVVLNSALRHTSSFKPPAAAGNADMISHVTPFFFPDTPIQPPRRAEARRQVLEAWAAIPWQHHQRLASLARIDVPAAAEQVKAPTLLIYGEQDRVCPFEPHGAELEEALGNCQHVLIENAGHFCYLEYPGLVAAALRAFIDGSPAA